VLVALVFALLGPTLCPVQERLLFVLLGVAALLGHVGLCDVTGNGPARRRVGRAKRVDEQIALGAISALGVSGGGRFGTGRLGGGPVPDVAGQVEVHQEGHEQELEDEPKPEHRDQGLKQPVGHEAAGDRVHEGKGCLERMDDWSHHRVLGNSPDGFRDLGACGAQGLDNLDPCRAASAKQGLDAAA